VAGVIHGLRLRGETDATVRGAIIEPSLFCREPIERAVGAGVTWLDPNTGDDAMFSADVGITSAAAAIAETGSLVCTSGPDCWRGLSLIPPIHVAVIRADQILPDLLDWFSGPPEPLPANITLISGPSKTADIEGILITGVHGPGEVHVVVVDP
jgi:L-lactate utilization protein LutC